MSNAQSFNDGVLAVYKLEDIAQPGGKPKARLAEKVPLLRYAERVVGMNRYWSGLQNKARVDWLVRTQRLDNVTTQNVVIRHDGEQYKIVQIQYPQDVAPRCMDLSLERVVERFDVD